MATISIPQEFKQVKKLVAIPEKDYRNFLSYQQELRDALVKITRGQAEYRAGKTKIIAELSDLVA